MKFKVGDLIKGTSPSQYCITNDKMTLGRVESVSPIGFITVKILKHKNSAEIGGVFPVDSRYFELASPREEVHITRDGDTVHAVYKRDGKIVKRNKAVCAPEDEFDFIKGSAIALGRVLGTGKIKPELTTFKFDFEDFRARKFAVNCQTKRDAEVFLAYLHGRGIKWGSRTTLPECTRWDIYESKTCYVCANRLLSYCCTRFCELEEHIPVIPFNRVDL